MALKNLQLQITTLFSLKYSKNENYKSQKNLEKQLQSCSQTKIIIFTNQLFLKVIKIIQTIFPLTIDISYLDTKANSFGINSLKICNGKKVRLLILMYKLTKNYSFFVEMSLSTTNRVALCKFGIFWLRFFDSICY